MRTTYARIRIILAGVITLFLGYMLVGASLASAQAPRLRNGPINKFSGVENTNQVCNTTGTTLVQMPDMVRTFTIGGTTSSSAVVMFSGAYWSALPSHVVRIQLTIDNVPNPGPGTATLLWLYQQDEDGGAPQTDSHGFTFQTDLLVPGTHTARIRWATNGAAGPITGCVGSRSMIVLHK